MNIKKYADDFISEYSKKYDLRLGKSFDKETANCAWFTKTFFDWAKEKDLPVKVVYYIHYTFAKPDQEIETTKSLQDTIPTNRIVSVFYKEGIEVEKQDIRYLDDSIEIEDWYTENLSSNQVDDALDKITDLLGATEWEFYHGTNGIRFQF